MDLQDPYTKPELELRTINNTITMNSLPIDPSPLFTHVEWVYLDGRRLPEENRQSLLQLAEAFTEYMAEHPEMRAKV